MQYQQCDIAVSRPLRYNCRPFSIFHRHGCSSTTHNSSFLLSHSPIPCTASPYINAKRLFTVWPQLSLWLPAENNSPQKAWPNRRENTSAFPVAECKSWISLGYPFQATVGQGKLANWRQPVRFTGLFWTGHTSAQKFHPQPCPADMPLHGNISQTLSPINTTPVEEASSKTCLFLPWFRKHKENSAFRLKTHITGI